MLKLILMFFYREGFQRDKTFIRSRACGEKPWKENYKGNVFHQHSI